MTCRNAQERHSRACRMLGHVLTLETDIEAWNGLAAVLECRLTDFERSCLLVAVVGSMDFEDALSIIEDIHQRARGGIPLPPFLDPFREATWWADHALLEERKAALAAAFLSLPALDQHAFLSSANRRAAA